MTNPNDSITLTREELEREIATWLARDMPVVLFKFISHICPNNPPDIKTRALLEQSLTDTLFTNARTDAADQVADMQLEMNILTTQHDNDLFLIAKVSEGLKSQKGLLETCRIFLGPKIWKELNEVTNAKAREEAELSKPLNIVDDRTRCTVCDMPFEENVAHEGKDIAAGMASVAIKKHAFQADTHRGELEA